MLVFIIFGLPKYLFLKTVNRQFSFPCREKIVLPLTPLTKLQYLRWKLVTLSDFPDIMSPVHMTSLQQKPRSRTGNTILAREQLFTVFTNVCVLFYALSELVDRSVVNGWGSKLSQELSPHWRGCLFFYRRRHSGASGTFDSSEWEVWRSFARRVCIKTLATITFKP